MLTRIVVNIRGAVFESTKQPRPVVEWSKELQDALYKAEPYSVLKIALDRPCETVLLLPAAMLKEAFFIVEECPNMPDNSMEDET